VAFQRRAEILGRGSLRVIERTLDRVLQEPRGVVRRQALQHEGAPLTPQAPPPRRHHECATRGDVEEVFQLILLDVNIVEKDQRLPSLKAASNLHFGGQPDLVA
jgi:hypothetical protein